MPHKRTRDHQAMMQSLRDCERVRAAMIPRVCRRYRAEYIAQDDKARTGKPATAYELDELRAIGAVEADRYTRLPHGI